MGANVSLAGGPPSLDSESNAFAHLDRGVASIRGVTSTAVRLEQDPGSDGRDTLSAALTMFLLLARR